MHKANVCPAELTTTFVASFISNYWLREGHLSAIAAGFDLRSQSNDIVLQNLSSSTKTQ